MEAAVAVHLIRNFEQRIFEGLANIEKVFYWRSTKGKEIDFVALCQDKFLPVEVKFQNIITRSDYSTMKRTFGKGILVTKIHFFAMTKFSGFQRRYSYSF